MCVNSATVYFIYKLFYDSIETIDPNKTENTNIVTVQYTPVQNQSFNESREIIPSRETPIVSMVAELV